MTNYFASSRTLDELKAAYRAAVKKWHPDLSHSPEATEMMKKINTDYEKRYTNCLIRPMDRSGNLF